MAEKIKKEKQNKINKKSKEIKKISGVKRCFICNGKEDDFGRCKCVNKDAWGINV